MQCSSPQCSVTRPAESERRFDLREEAILQRVQPCLTRITTLDEARKATEKGGREGKQHVPSGPIAPHLSAV